MKKYPITKYIFFILGILYLGYLFLAIKKPCNTVVLVDFEEAAHKLWLANEKEQIKLDKKEEPRTVFTYKNDESTLFYKTVLNGYLESIPQKSYLLICKLLEILDNNSNLSSVSSNFLIDAENDLLSQQNTYSLLSKINLLEHTLNVARQIIVIAKEKLSDDSFNIHIGNILIVSLAHDIGKITRLKSNDIYKQENHSSIGGKKIKSLLDDFGIFGKSSSDIIDAVECHHVQQIDGTKIPLYRELLISADRKARELELEKIGNMRQDETVAPQTQIIAAAPDTMPKLEHTADKEAGKSKETLEWFSMLKKDIKEYLWNKFVEALSQKKQYVYIYNDVCFFEKTYFEEIITLFFHDRKLQDFYIRKPMGITAEDNVELVVKILKQDKATLAQDDFNFGLISIQYKSRWKSNIPCYSVKAPYICKNQVTIKELVRITPSLKSITTIVFNTPKE